MSNSASQRKAIQEIRVATARVRPDPRPNVELHERDHLHDLFLRLIPLVYQYGGLSVEEIVRGVALRLSAAEAQYLVERLGQVRKKRNLIVVSRGDEAVLLPVAPGVDPLNVPLAATWTDGGFYTARERAHSNGSKLRKLGLPDGVAGYASYRNVIFQPTVGHSTWQSEPTQIAGRSSYEAEAVAARLGLEDLLGRLEDDRQLPAADQFQVLLFSDCQSLIAALKAPAQPEEAAASELARLREVIGLFAGFQPRWEARRRIKRRLGH